MPVSKELKELQIVILQIRDKLKSEEIQLHKSAINSFTIEFNKDFEQVDLRIFENLLSRYFQENKDDPIFENYIIGCAVVGFNRISVQFSLKVIKHLKIEQVVLP